MNFGDNLRELRKLRKMSQEQLAEKVNVSRQSISKWENGEAYPEMKNIMLLCDIFNCKINELVNDSITDANSFDQEVQQVVIKFKEEQQKRIKILSKTTFIFAKIAKGILLLLFVGVFVALFIFPFLLKDATITEDKIILFNQEKDYFINDYNNLVIDGQEIYTHTSTNLKDFISNHSITFYKVSVEYIIICYVIELVLTILLFHNLEKLYKNIYDEDTPFTIDNVKNMKLIALFLGIRILFPKIVATIYSIVVGLDLGIEYNPIDIVVILIVVSLTYIFKYGYEIQLDSRGKIYGNEKSTEK